MCMLLGISGMLRGISSMLVCITDILCIYLGFSVDCFDSFLCLVLHLVADFWGAKRMWV